MIIYIINNTRCSVDIIKRILSIHEKPLHQSATKTTRIRKYVYASREKNIRICTKPHIYIPGVLTFRKTCKDENECHNRPSHNFRKTCLQQVCILYVNATNSSIHLLLIIYTPIILSNKRKFNIQLIDTALTT